mgnify:CR=1 FL=1
MRYQKHPYSCGAAAVVNAVRCFGKRVAEMKVRSFSSTTKEDGTDEHGIIAALRGLGHDGESFSTGSKDAALDRLFVSLADGHPVIICTQNMQHWITVIGYIGVDSGNIMYVVADPTNTQRNKEENGVHVLSPKLLKKSWQARDGKYFGIRCIR